MKNKKSNHQTLSPVSPLLEHRPTPFRQLIDAQECYRKVRIAIPLPRHPACVTRRTMLAAMRAAELEEWTSNGGDYLSSMHQPVH